MNIISNLPLAGQDQDVSFAFWVDGGAGKNLTVAAFAAEEAVFALTKVELMLTASTDMPEPEALIGRKATLAIQTRPRPSERFFSGIIVEVESGEIAEREACIRVLLLPVVYRLQTRPRCRIFENLTVPDIVRRVFSEHGIPDVIWQLANSYKPMNYCLQYRESDFAFVNRILGEAGIFYHFNHKEEGRHQIIVSDRSQMLLDCPGQAQLEYISNEAERQKGACCIALKRRLKLSAQAAFNATQTTSVLSAPDNEKKTFSRIDDASSQQKIKADIVEVFGIANAPMLTSGFGVTVNRHPNSAFNSRWRLLNIRHEGVRRGVGALFGFAGEGGSTDLFFDRPVLKSPGLLSEACNDTEYDSDAFASALKGGKQRYACAFDALDYKLPYQPSKDRRPAIDGPQKARVIATRKEKTALGEGLRIKVRLLWDEDSYLALDGSTCWVDVVPSVSGAVQAVKEGDEIIVEFLGGDGDRPVVINRGISENGDAGFIAKDFSEDDPADDLAGLETMEQSLILAVEGNNQSDTDSVEGSRDESRIVSVDETHNRLMSDDIIVQTDKNINEYTGHSRIIGIERHKREDIKGVYELNSEKFLCKTTTLTIDAGEKLVIRGPGGRILIDDTSIIFDSPNIVFKGKVTKVEASRKRLENIKAAMHNELPFAGKGKALKSKTGTKS